MGSNNSRDNSNMSGNDQEGETPRVRNLESYVAEDDPDLPSLVAFLIRSGQIRFISNDNNDIGMADSDDSDTYSDHGYHDGDFVARCKPAPVDKNPDTSLVKASDLHAQVLQSSGLNSDPCWTHYLRPSFINRMIKREIGLNQQKQFSNGDKCYISNKFLPSKMSVLESYNHKAFCGSYSNDGNIFVSACQDQVIRVYNTKDDAFQLLKSMKAKDVGWSVLDTAFSPDGRYAAYSSWSDCIHLCNLYGEHEINETLPLNPGDYSFCVFSLKFSNDNREILGGANDGNLYVYDREANKRTLKISAHDDDVNTVCFADDSSQILFSGGDDGLCKVWDRRTWSETNPHPVGIMAGHTDGITFIDSKGDARYFISNSKDQSLKLWDVRRFSDEAGIEHTRIAVATQRWDYRWQQVPKRMFQRTGLPGDSSLMTYRGHRVLNTLIRCRFSPVENTGQRYVYTGCASGSCIVYDILTGEIVCKLQGHSSCVRDVSWHPYENIIVSTSWDGILGKWYYNPHEEDDDSEAQMSIGRSRRDL